MTHLNFSSSPTCAERELLLQLLQNFAIIVSAIAIAHWKIDLQWLKLRAALLHHKNHIKIIDFFLTHSRSLFKLHHWKDKSFQTINLWIKFNRGQYFSRHLLIKRVFSTNHFCGHFSTSFNLKHFYTFMMDGLHELQWNKIIQFRKTSFVTKKKQKISHIFFHSININWVWNGLVRKSTLK